MYRIAHISDTHLSINADNHIIIFEKILRSISQYRCNHLFITGDISDTSLPEDFEIIRRLLKKYNYLDSDKLSVTIGNHDIFGGAERGDNVYLFPDKCRRTDYYFKIKQFRNFFRESFQKAIIPHKQRIFPFYKILNEHYAIIGINSVAQWSADKNPIASNGYIDGVNMKNISNILSSEDFRNRIKIVLIHHQFYEPDLTVGDKVHNLWFYSERNTMKLHNKDEALQLFGTSGVNLVFHGHTHLTNDYKIGKNIFINSSGCTVPFTDKKSYSYNIIDFNSSKKLKYKIIKVSVKI